MENVDFTQARGTFARENKVKDLSLIRTNLGKTPQEALDQGDFLEAIGMISSKVPVGYNEKGTPEAQLYATFSVDPEDCRT